MPIDIGLNDKARESSAQALRVLLGETSSEMVEEATIKPDNGVPDAEAMLSNLVKGHEAISRAAKIGLKVADENNDIVTADLMTRRADVSEKTAWMLRANL